MQTRGCLYIVWPGRIDSEALLQRSLNSLEATNPKLGIHVVRLPAGSTLLDKARMGEFAPYDTTLYLDADTVVLGSLGFAFQKAEQHGVAVAICECPWARRFNSCESVGRDMVEYNTGVIAWSRKAKELMNRWKRLSMSVGASMRFHNERQEIATMHNNDQASFALAMEQTMTNPFVLPCNWNYRPKWQKSFWGPIRIWHDEKPPPQALLDVTVEQEMPQAVVRYMTLGK